MELGNPLVKGHHLKKVIFPITKFPDLPSIASEVGNPQWKIDRTIPSGAVKKCEH